MGCKDPLERVGISQTWENWGAGTKQGCSGDLPALGYKAHLERSNISQIQGFLIITNNQELFPF